MREILFRGKDSDGVWHYSMTIARAATTDGEISHIYFGSCPTCSVPAETVGQYTNIVDKNGTKIFEGDIVLDEYDFNIVGLVVYNPSRSQFEILDVEHSNYTFNIGALKDTLKVIGNIHDNPELLKAGECNENN